MFRLPAALVVTVAAGLASRLLPTGFHWWDSVAGDVLYGVAAYLVCAMMLPRTSPRKVSMIAGACCLAVETLKLTGIPADHRNVFFVRWLLGTTFDAANLVWYSSGVTMAGVFDHATRGPKCAADGPQHPA